MSKGLNRNSIVESKPAGKTVPVHAHFHKSLHFNSKHILSRY